MADVSGHLRLVERKRGPQWYAKWRDADGRQHQRRLGPAWTERRPPQPGYLTRKIAEAELAGILTDARRAGPKPTGAAAASFADAAAEFVRYKREVEKCDATTLKDYEGVINGGEPAVTGGDWFLAEVSSPWDRFQLNAPATPEADQQALEAATRILGDDAVRAGGGR